MEKSTGTSRRQWLRKTIGLGLGGLSVWGCTDPASTAPKPEKHPYKVIKVYPHHTDAYTQGLIYHDGFLFESTGQYGHSTMRKVELATGKVVGKKYHLPRDYFAEGLTLWKGRFYQLTYEAKVGFIYEWKKNTFVNVGRFPYPDKSIREGWGLTHDGTHFIMSDGTDRLFFFDPKTFKLDRVVHVYNNRGKVQSINEMEYVRGEIFANQYQTDLILRISPKTGKVLGEIDLSQILPWEDRRHLKVNDEVLNGIAWDSKKDHLFVTGKHWPKLFEIQLSKSE